MPIRRVLWLAGAVLLGGSLAYAPVAAFFDDMVTVTKVGLAGAALLLIARLMPNASRGSPGERARDDETRG